MKIAARLIADALKRGVDGFQGRAGGVAMGRQR